jgi:hypothetical protein
MPKLGRLRLQRLNKMRMRMAQSVDSDAGAEIKIGFAFLIKQPTAFAAFKGDIETRESRQQSGGG